MKSCKAGQYSFQEKVYLTRLSSIHFYVFISEVQKLGHADCFSKQLVGIYAAFDRRTYEELIPRHLYDIALFPNYLTEHFKNGGFSVRLSETEWRSITLDECHEMCIYKDAKLAVVRPAPDKMKSIANYLPFRAKSVNNLTTQILPQKNPTLTVIQLTL